MSVNSKNGVSTPYIEGTVIGGETLTLDVTSGNLASHDATIPSGTTRVVCVPSAGIHWGNNKTVTSSVGYTAAAGEGFVIEHDQIASAEIIADSATPTLVVVYLGTPS